MSDTNHTSPDANNVIPEGEMARRRRVIDLADDVADLFRDIGDRTKEFSELGLKTPEWMDLVVSRFSERTQDAIEKVFDFLPSGWDAMTKWLEGEDIGNVMMEAGVGLGAAVGAALGRRNSGDKLESVERARVRNIAATLERLFSDAPKLEDGSGKPIENQAPALECHVLLRGCTTDMYGSLSVTPDGVLKMLTPGERREPGKPTRTILCEQFFDLSDVMSVMVEREVKAAPSSVIFKG